LKEVDVKCRTLEENAAKLSSEFEKQKLEIESLRGQLNEANTQRELAKKNSHQNQSKIYQKILRK
jgi:hypothetical protein